MIERRSFEFPSLASYKENEERLRKAAEGFFFEGQVVRVTIEPVEMNIVRVDETGFSVRPHWRNVQVELHVGEVLRLGGSELRDALERFKAHFVPIGPGSGIRFVVPNPNPAVRTVRSCTSDNSLLEIWSPDEIDWEGFDDAEGW